MVPMRPTIRQSVSRIRGGMPGVKTAGRGGFACHSEERARKEGAVTNPPTPRHPESGNDPDDLPDVFQGLIGIDVIDGELVPRASAEPPRA